MGASCVYSINFSPTVAGALSGSMILTYNASLGMQTISLNGIAAPIITLSPSSLLSAVPSTPYSQAIVAGGGTAPYTYVLSAGTLPAGLFLINSTGVLSGTPTSGGTFTIKAIDSTGSNLGGPYNATQSYTLTLSALALMPSSLTTATVGTAYSAIITASGGTPSYSYTATAGSLPAGLVLSSTGVLSGTPTAAGSFGFTVKAADSGFYIGAQAYSLTVNAPTITILPSSLTTGTVGTAYSTALTASNGTSPYTYIIIEGAPPSGLALSTIGVLSGTPTGSGTFNFTVKATDSSTGTGSPFSGIQAYTLTVLSAPSAGYTVVANPTSLTIARGNTGSSVLTFTPTGGYQGTATFGCSGLPAYATCTFTPSTVVFTGDNAVKTTTLQVITTAPHAAGGTNLSAIFWIPGGVLAGLLFMRRRKLTAAMRGLLLLAVLACVSLGITACGGGTALTGGTPTGTDTVQVNVSAAATVGSGSGNVNQSASISITIQ